MVVGEGGYGRLFGFLGGRVWVEDEFRIGFGVKIRRGYGSSFL